MEFPSLSTPDSAPLQRNTEHRSQHRAAHRRSASYTALPSKNKQRTSAQRHYFRTLSMRPLLPQTVTLETHSDVQSFSRHCTGSSCARLAHSQTAAVTNGTHQNTDFNVETPKHTFPRRVVQSLLQLQLRSLPRANTAPPLGITHNATVLFTDPGKHKNFRNQASHLRSASLLASARRSFGE